MEEKRVYVNMDRSLIKKGGRKAAKITKEDLFKKIYMMQKANEPDGETDEVSFEEFTLGMVCVDELAGNSQIYKDLSKIKFDGENYLADPDDLTEESLLGLHTLSNGLTFLGMVAGGDWEQGLFFIIYWSGKALRGYIPSYGNTFNPDFKTAFGSEGTNKSIDNEKIYARAPYNDCEMFEAAQRYLSSIVPAEEVVADMQAFINWDAIKEDIMNRIDVM